MRCRGDAGVEKRGIDIYIYIYIYIDRSDLTLPTPIKCDDMFTLLNILVIFLWLLSFYFWAFKMSKEPFCIIFFGPIEAVNLFMLQYVHNLFLKLCKFCFKDFSYFTWWGKCHRNFKFYALCWVTTICPQLLKSWFLN